MRWCWRATTPRAPGDFLGRVLHHDLGLFREFVDEAYAIADPEWINAKKTTPAGLTIQQLEQAMEALRDA